MRKNLFPHYAFTIRLCSPILYPLIELSYRLQHMFEILVYAAQIDEQEDFSLW